uniref:LexA family protein n=1 Tax=uncultured Acinetobacter sp. TaxID=165433 RepID=UPI0026339997|nr:translesion error-prone DNA polymerase V autoproteolytic subunit [uncultured Acinetobacter sp.]
MSKRIPIYFSDVAWATLENIMGKDGSPSPTINALLEPNKLNESSPLGGNSLSAKRVVKSSQVKIAVALERVSAGFPSPAQDYTEATLDLNELMVGNELATFIVEANSLSMLNAGIDIGDKLIVDRSLEAFDHDIVIAMIDNDFTVKRLVIQSDLIYLKAENPDFNDIYLEDGQELLIWGVVTNIIKATRKRK